ncbi:phage baseplate upper protein [Tetragenococcus halophilus]|uniref:Phage baseplate upper protein n=1 Tax=Tetragenococcus halophilus TaxID=51669 RepID=A0AB35HQL7_TETHA|nr:phage baseplate upper protein [Tetragenococcus halophilus]MCO8298457.1 phage baseplate upper protein [Tetragenococcus halophilus]
MPVLKKGEIKVRATAYGTEVKSTGYVFYSYDKNSSALFFQFRNQNGEPTDIANAKIHLLMILEDDEGKEFIPGQEDFEIISKPGGKAKFVLPEMLLSYQGKVAGYINLDFEDGSHTDEGQFSFRIRRSMITRVLPAMGDKYVQDFEDIKERVEQAEDSTRNDFKDSVESTGKAETKAKNDMQDSVDQVNKDYEVWKAEQEEEQTGFESDFADWKTTQETKQTNFESETSKKITDINQTLETTDSQVQETNNALENLDAYTKVETDEKLKEKADKTALNKKVEIGEREFLTPEKTFENFYQEDIESNRSTWLQVIVQGSVGYIFGTVKNTVELESGFSTVVCSLPEELDILTTTSVTITGNDNKSATIKIINSGDASNPNEVKMYRFKDKMEPSGATKGERFDLFGVFHIAIS